jgi:hypothetical protein
LIPSAEHGKRGIESPDGTPCFPEETGVQAHALGHPSISDVAPFVALEVGVDEAAARRLLPFVARALGLSERELAEALRRAL